MEKLISCAFNMDTACVELHFTDGSIYSICLILLNSLKKTHFNLHTSFIRRFPAFLFRR